MVSFNLPKGIFLTNSSPLITPTTLRNPFFSIFCRLILDTMTNLSLYASSSSLILRILSDFSAITDGI
jgi:hypothetical protein